MNILKSRGSRINVLIVIIASIVIFAFVLVKLLNDSTNLKNIDSSDNSSLVNDWQQEEYTYARNLKNTDKISNEDLANNIVSNVANQAIDNLDCRLFKGTSNAVKLGIVTVPTLDGTSYAVISDSGTITEGSIEFSPNHVRIGSMPDGQVLFGLANLRLNSGVFRPPSSDEPVIIYQNDHIIYESNKVLDFDIATDGTSFIVHEPISSNNSRLVARDMSLGTETHFDLGSSASPYTAYAPGPALRYSMDLSEAMFVPAEPLSTGLGKYQFYGIGNGQTTQIVIDGGFSATLTSSKDGYFVDYVDGEDYVADENSWEISRKKLDLKTKSTDIVWSQMVEMKDFSGTMRVSNNGKWLGLWGDEFLLLDTYTGKELFRFIDEADFDGSKSKGQSSLSQQNNPYQPLSLRHIRFLENSLVMHWLKGDVPRCESSTGQTFDQRVYRECLRDHRLTRGYQNFLDIYDLESIEKLGQLSRRIEVYAETNCNEMRDGYGLSRHRGYISYESSSIKDTRP